MTAELLAAVIMVTGDGEAREAKAWPLGDYSCPFCSAAVPSPAGWAESQRLNAEHYAKAGEPYDVQPYTASMRQTWEARTCPNPCCLVGMSAEQCARIRGERDARQAEADRRKRQHERAMEQIAETRASQSAACDAARAKCQAEGYCFACWRHSTSSGLSDYRVTWTRHRDPENCPRLRTRYRY